MTKTICLQIAAGLIIPIILIIIKLLRTKKKISLTILLSVFVVFTIVFFSASFLYNDYIDMSIDEVITSTENYLNNTSYLKDELINVKTKDYERLLNYTENNPYAQNMLELQYKNTTSAELWRRIKDSHPENNADIEKMSTLLESININLGISDVKKNITENKLSETFLQNENKKATLLGDYTFHSYSADENVLYDYVNFNSLIFKGNIEYNYSEETNLYTITTSDSAYIRYKSEYINLVEFIFDGNIILGEKNTIDKIIIGQLVLENPEILILPDHIEIFFNGNSSIDNDSIPAEELLNTKSSKIKTNSKNLTTILNNDFVYFKISTEAILPEVAIIYKNIDIFYPPEINISSNIEPIYDINTHINGKTDKNAKIYINNLEIEKNIDGDYSHTVSLSRGKNNFIIEAVSKDGLSMTRRDIVITRLSNDIKIFRLYKEIPNVFTFLFVLINVSVLTYAVLNYISGKSLYEMINLLIKVFLSAGVICVAYVIIQPFSNSEIYATIAASNAYKAILLMDIKNFIISISIGLFIIAFILYLSTLYIHTRMRNIKHRR